MSDFSIYPDAIDGYSQLPLVVDTVTRVDAISVNRLRSAIINIERELGVLPSGSNYDTVKERLDALELIVFGVTTTTSSTTLTLDNNIVLVNASSGPITITLTDATDGATRFDIKKIDSSDNAVTIATQSSQTIDGQSGIIINTQYDSYTVVSNGENWFII